MGINNMSPKKEREIAERNMRSRLKDIKNSCDHKDHNGPCLCNLNKAIEDGIIPLMKNNATEYPEGSVVCEDCKDIFSMYSYTRQDLSDIVFDIRSVFSQIKVMAELNDSEYADLIEMMDVIEKNLDNIFSFYNGMVKMFANPNGKKKSEGGRSSKGRVAEGITIGKFK